MIRTIGIDFDNTIVSYDELMHRIAVQRRLVEPDSEPTKRAVRDRVRLMAAGEIEWQKVQALAYGPLMADARLLDGVEQFIRQCREHGLPVCVVSHKTEYAPYDETRTNLREAAMAWMATHGFFASDGLNLNPAAVYFESTRAEKIARIRAIGCSHFIDDLEEVFLEPSFPVDVQKILFAPGAAATPESGAMVLPTWRAVCDYFFNGHC